MALTQNAGTSSPRRPADVIRATLSQYLGPFTSKSAVQLMAKQTFGVEADAVTLAQVPALLDALGPTLRTLLGKAGAEKVFEQVRQELAL